MVTEGTKLLNGANESSVAFSTFSAFNTGPIPRTCHHYLQLQKL